MQWYEGWGEDGYKTSSKHNIILLLGVNSLLSWNMSIWHAQGKPRTACVTKYLWKCTANVEACHSALYRVAWFYKKNQLSLWSASDHTSDLTTRTQASQYTNHPAYTLGELYSGIKGYEVWLTCGDVLFTSEASTSTANIQQRKKVSSSQWTPIPNIIDAHQFALLVRKVRQIILCRSVDKTNKPNRHLSCQVLPLVLHEQRLSLYTIIDQQPSVPLDHMQMHEKMVRGNHTGINMQAC